MSETAPEGTAGDTGVVTDPATGVHPEDQQAEESLHELMQAEDPDELKKQIARWRSAAQQHERTARDNSAAAAKLRQIEEANKTDLERAVARQQEAERERDAANAQTARLMAAAAHNLDPDLIDYLGEGTAQEISSRAEALAGVIEKTVAAKLAQLTQQNGGRVPVGARQPTRPVERLSPGSMPAGSAPSDKNDLFRQYLQQTTE